MGKFVITKRSNGEYQFNLKAGNGETILSSEGYSTKTNCLSGIESVRKHSTDDSNYDRKMSSDDKYYFNLEASNGKVIGVSERYANAGGREKGIASVKENAPNSPVDDHTI